MTHLAGIAGLLLLCTILFWPVMTRGSLGRQLRAPPIVQLRRRSGFTTLLQIGAFCVVLWWFRRFSGAEHPIGWLGSILFSLLGAFVITEIMARLADRARAARAARRSARDG